MKHHGEGEGEDGAGISNPHHAGDWLVVNGINRSAWVFNVLVVPWFGIIRMIPLFGISNVCVLPWSGKYLD